MNYLLRIRNRYYFNRRVPAEIKPYDARPLVRVALKTDSRKEAVRLALLQNDHLESYWRELVLTSKTHDAASYEQVVQKARLLGFTYLPCQVIAESSLHEIHRRVQKADSANNCPLTVAAILGGVEKPRIMLCEVIERYFSFTKNKIINKSNNQIRKWVNPRKLAMKTLIECIGDKELMHLSRDDLIKYRDWWLHRIDTQKAVASTANKNLIHVKEIIQTVNENMKLQLDSQHIFSKLLLENSGETQRLPFDTDYIAQTLLNPENLADLNEQARWSLYAMAETGAGISEQLGLLPEDIKLDAEIPHIIITPRHKKALKTRYRKRTIPLVGYALDAFKACPNGFTDYRGRPDSLSGLLSKYLKEHDLLPSENHTVYSLRHSFQDRLLAANAPDRVQADLMGHKFQRQAYGKGASLEQKYEWLEKIKLKPA